MVQEVPQAQDGSVEGITGDDYSISIPPEAFNRAPGKVTSGVYDCNNGHLWCLHNPFQFSFPVLLQLMLLPTTTGMCLIFFQQICQTLQFLQMAGMHTHCVVSLDTNQCYVSVLLS